jgi:hypothetical protein
VPESVARLEPVPLSVGATVRGVLLL